MKITLDYGKTGLDVTLPDDRLIARRWRSAPADPLADPAAALEAALAKPIGTKPLAELAKGKKTACIVVCDITRPVPNKLILPPVLAHARSGRRPAGGHHHPRRHRPAPAERGRGTGRAGRRGRREELPQREPPRQGDARSTITSARRRTACRRGSTGATLQADLKITTGLIEPHLMAGYSRRAQGHLPRHRGAGNGEGLARAEVPRTPEGRLRHRRGQPGPRGEHAHRADGRLRLHRQRLHRRPAPRHLGRGPAT